jgi:vancomycin resistance protein YoaR
LSQDHHWPPEPGAEKTELMSVTPAKPPNKDASATNPPATNSPAGKDSQGNNPFDAPTVRSRPVAPVTPPGGLPQPTVTQPTVNQPTVSVPTVNQQAVTQPTVTQPTVNQQTVSAPVPPDQSGQAGVAPIPGADAPTVRVRVPRAGFGGLKKPRKPLLVAGVAVGLLALLYIVDLVVSTGNVPRGVTVAGVDVGGMTRTAAEERLRDQIEPRMSQPIKVKAGDTSEAIIPQDAGLAMDWPATLELAGDQPLNPITRLLSFFTTEEVGFATKTEQTRLAGAIDELRSKVDREATEGTIRFDGVTPVVVEPKQGQKLDLAAAKQAVLDKWATGQTIELSVSTTPVKTSAANIQEALTQIAEPAVSGPVTVHGEGKDATFKPEGIAKSLVFEPTEDGHLNARLDPAKVVEAIGPQLKSTEKEGKDATIVFSGGQPSVQPSVDGLVVKWDDVTLGELMNVLKRTDDREMDAQYEHKPAKVTTEQANQLGITEVIGEFSTGGFAQDSGVNIRTVAQKVNGAIVKPGETFSLNGFTGPRGAAQGYVEAGVIKDGAPGREVGGGISQFATTLYNASYFAGMKDAGHKEHSFYISRYPAAREATVFQDHNGTSLIDLKFTNDAQTGVAIQAIWTPSSITVKLWGTKRYIVESVPGERTNPTEPVAKPGPPENCHASNGAPGFTASDTRVIKDAKTGQEIRRDTRTVKYNPQPKITCGPPPGPPGA